MFGAGSSPLLHQPPWWVGPAGAELAASPNWAAPIIYAFCATLLAAVAIRLMDEHLDRYRDELVERMTVGRWLGDGALPYAMLALAVSTLVATRLAIVLFLAAYAVGMAGELRRTLPSGMPGFAEAMLALLIGVCGAGWAGMAWAFCGMAALQCADDCLDRTIDSRSGQANLCRRWGSGEVGMAGLFFLGCAVRLSLVLTGVVLVAAVVTQLVWAMLVTHISRNVPVTGGLTHDDCCD